MNAVTLKIIQVPAQHSGPQEHALASERISIGRNPDNVLPLPDPETMRVSRYHAEIARRDDEYYLTDLNSRNGTFVNGERLPIKQPQLLHEGDRIQLGDFVLQFFPPRVGTAPVDGAPIVSSELDENTRRLQKELTAQHGRVQTLTVERDQLLARRRETENIIHTMRDEAQHLQDENRQLRDLLTAKELRFQSTAPAARADQEEFAAKLREAQATIEMLREENQSLRTLINVSGPPPPMSDPTTARLHQILDLLLEAVTKLIAGSSRFQIELIGTRIHPPYFAKIYISSSQELKEHLLNQSVSEKEKTALINALKQILDRVIAHQMALLDGYRKCVNEVPQNLLQLLDPEKLSKELAEDRQAKISIFSEKKLWQAYRARHGELMKEDRRFFEEKIFRPVFIKGYNERMDSVWMEITGVKKL